MAIPILHHELILATDFHGLSQGFSTTPNVSAAGKAEKAMSNSRTSQTFRASIRFGPRLSTILHQLIEFDGRDTDVLRSGLSTNVAWRKVARHRGAASEIASPLAETITMLHETA